MLDMEASNLEQITDLVLDNMINKGALPFEIRDKVSCSNFHVQFPINLNAIEIELFSNMNILPQSNGNLWRTINNTWFLEQKYRIENISYM